MRSQVPQAQSAMFCALYIQMPVIVWADSYTNNTTQVCRAHADKMQFPHLSLEEVMMTVVKILGGTDLSGICIAFNLPSD